MREKHEQDEYMAMAQHQQQKSSNQSNLEKKIREEFENRKLKYNNEIK